MTNSTFLGVASARPEVTIVVYTQPNCMQCKMTYRELDNHGLPYKVVDLSEDPDALQMVKGLGYRTAPVVKVGDDHWGGFRPDRISAVKARLIALG